jgi:type VI secretion system secreted protein Hcp
MAQDIFLKLDGIKGESRDAKHKDEMDVTNWSWSLSQSGTMHQGSGGGGGKVAVYDLAIMKYIDRASPNLIMACCSGKHFKEAVLTIRKAGGDKPLEYLRITMKQVLVTSYRVEANRSEERLLESVMFNFAEAMTEYTPQRADGAGDASIQVAWNIAANTPA